MNSSHIRQKLMLGTIALCSLALAVAPYASLALETLKASNPEGKPEDNPANPANNGTNAPEMPQTERTTIEVRMTRYDAAALEMTRFHTHPKILPQDTAILQHAFELGIRSAGNFHPCHVSRGLLDRGGPDGGLTARVDATGRQLAQLEVLRHDLTAPGEDLASLDEALLVAIRRGLQHIRHFGMLPTGEGHGMHAPIAVPMPYVV